MSDNYKALVTTIEEVLPVENAEKLKYVNIGGTPVIVDNTYRVGDLCLFFSVGTKIEEWFLTENKLTKDLGGYFNSNGKVGSLKLRGTYSLGFLYRLSIEQITNNNLVDTQLISVLDNKPLCGKYTSFVIEEKQFKQRQNQPKSKYQKHFSHNFREHTDTPNLNYAVDSISPDTKIILTCKIHGTSGRTANLKVVNNSSSGLMRFHIPSYAIQTGTRRVNKISSLDKNVNLDGGYYGVDDLMRINYHKRIAKWLPKNYSVFYEIAGNLPSNRPIQPMQDKKSFEYTCARGESKCWIYKITWFDGNNHNILSYDEMTKLLNSFDLGENVFCIPEMLRTKFENKKQLLMLLDELEKQYFHNDPIGGLDHPNEGFVLRIQEDCERFIKYKTRWFTHNEALISDTMSTVD